MATNITKPDVLAKPFAADGEKNTIPTAATGTNRASLTEGFPPITGRSVENDDGIPPEKNDFNGLGYLLSQFCFALQNGWFPTFDADVSTAIGGYPLGAVLWYATGNYLVKSLKANNTDNFVSDPTKIDGISWQQITINSISGKADTDLNNCTKPYVKETYKNGVNWYRLWSDGWLEQGGQVSVTGAGGTDTVYTVPLHKAYDSTSYMVFKNYNSSQSTNCLDREASCYNKTVSSFDTACDSNDTSSFDWYAQGWAATEN